MDATENEEQVGWLLVYISTNPNGVKLAHTSHVGVYAWHVAAPRIACVVLGRRETARR
jgi:hypothetical protein